MRADPLEHLEALGPIDVAFVLAFRSELTGANVSNKLVADYVRAHSDRLIGFASIDPLAGNVLGQLDQAVATGFAGVTVSPAAQGFHPMDTRAVPLYERLSETGMPLIVTSGPAVSPKACLEFAQPMLLDEVLRTFPNLRLIVGSMGAPFVEQTLALLAKHSNATANIAGLPARPWQAYNALQSAVQMDVIDQLLFASDFPYGDAADAIEALYSINQIAQGTNLPAIPREMLRGIVERDALAMLRLARPAASPARPLTPLVNAE